MSPSQIVAVVDDDLAVLDSMKFLLEAAGYEVAAYDSATAFLADRAALPACLIVDQQMPNMTGLDLVRHLRKCDVSVPALLITGSPTQSIVARANELGVKVLEKPPVETEVIKFIDANL
jgi:two-component system response regulator FixJ